MLDKDEVEIEEFRTKKIKESEEYKRILEKQLILLEKVNITNKKIKELEKEIELL